MKIAWTRLAISDLEQAYNYIAQSNPGAAVNTIERIQKAENGGVFTPGVPPGDPRFSKTAVDTLSLYPQIGRSGRVAGTRELVVSGTPFIVPYRVQSEQVEILAVIHGARRWTDSF